MYDQRMATMVRKQVYIRPDQEKRLKQAAADEGVTESALIRRGIDGVLSDDADVDVLSAARGDGRRTREGARIDFLNLLAELSQRPPTGQPPFKWDRDEVYAERLDRFLH